MAHRTRWHEEKRTGLELVAEWVETHPTAAAAARAIGASPQQLWGYLNDPDRGWDKELCFRASRISGIPVEAIMFKSTRVCDLLSDDPPVLKAAG